MRARPTVEINKSPSPSGKVVDIIDGQLRELAEIRNPEASDTELSKLTDELKSEIVPVNVFYPWRAVVVRMLPENEFFEIKTNRNKNIINKSEQTKLREFNISIAGMSIGSTIFYSLIGTGVGRAFQLADDDTFSTSNLNRVQATILDVGQDKVDTAIMRALELDPFLRISSLDGRINPQNIEEFSNHGATDLIIEETDDFRMKLYLREHAKKHEIPLVMFTNIGDAIMLDVERYDRGDADLFNGLLNPSLLAKMKQGDISDDDGKAIALSLVDQSMLTERIVNTVKGIGREYVGRPQLNGTVTVSGGLAPYIIRRLLVWDDLASGRYKLELGALVRLG